MVEQIAFNYCILDNKTIRDCATSPRILPPKFKKLAPEQERLFAEIGLELRENQQFNIGRELCWKNQVFKSTASVIARGETRILISQASKIKSNTSAVPI